MENKKRRCFSCKNYDSYYIKKNIKYEKTGLGYCRKKGCSVNNCDGCEEYVFKPKRKKAITAPYFYLDYLLSEISALRQIIEENNDENEKL